METSTLDNAQSDLQQAQAALAAAQKRHDDAVKASKPKRTPQAVMGDWMRAVNMRLENHPELRDLLAEFQELIEPPAPPETATASDQAHAE